MFCTRIRSNVKVLAENLTSAEEDFRFLPVLKSFEESNSEILSQTQKIENLKTVRKAFLHAKKRAKNFQGVSKFSSKTEAYQIIECRIVERRL